jgi:hypothetical protein
MSALSPLERVALALIAVLTTLAGVANSQAWPAVPRFAIATLALAGLAWVVSFATEQLGERFGPGVTGMLQSTLGNLPELFVVIFALEKGELVAPGHRLILANALLLGLVIVVGARQAPDGMMRFSSVCPGTPRRCCRSRCSSSFFRSRWPPTTESSCEGDLVGAICRWWSMWVVPYLRPTRAGRQHVEDASGAGLMMRSHRLRHRALYGPDRPRSRRYSLRSGLAC